MNAYRALTKGGTTRIESTSADVNTAITDKSGGKSKFYNHLIGSFQKEWSSSPSWYIQRFRQYYECFAEPGSMQFLINSQSPLVTGQGVHSVLETHLTLHRIYGIPYLPGTALKGIAAHYCHTYLGKKSPSFRIGGEHYNVLFGSSGQAGFIHYHDALPTPDTVGASLCLDVLTPHHGAYNMPASLPGDRNKEPAAPRDDDSPVPVPFLAVSAAFQVLLTCEGDADSTEKWLQLARAVVTAALLQEGFGGKTNAGYGRFRA